MNYTILFFITTLLLKVVLGIFIPLFSDEAYYWVWSHHPQLSYFDHPPMVSWLFYLGIPLENYFSAPRIPGIILGHLTLFIWYKLISPYIDKEKQKWLLWALLLTPLTGLGSLIITPDLPLMFFWSASLFFFLRLIKDKKASDSLLLGAALGLGFCSKYHVVLFPILALLWLFKRRRTLILPCRIYALTFVAALFFSLPVLYWNFKNDFVSFKFQLNHGLGQTSFNPYWSLKYIFDQFILILPPIVFLTLQKPSEMILKKDLSWLYYFGWGPVIFFLATSFKGRVEANWSLVGIPALITLAVINSKPGLRLIKVSVVIWFSALALVLGAVFLPSKTLNINNSKIREMRDTKLLLPLVSEFVPLYVSTYQMASLLAYYSKKPIFKLQGVGRIDFFDFLEPSKPQYRKFYWIAPSPSYLPQWARGYVVKQVMPTAVATDNFLFEVSAP